MNNPINVTHSLGTASNLIELYHIINGGLEQIEENKRVFGKSKKTAKVIFTYKETKLISKSLKSYIDNLVIETNGN